MRLITINEPKTKYALQLEEFSTKLDAKEKVIMETCQALQSEMHNLQWTGRWSEDIGKDLSSEFEQLKYAKQELASHISKNMKRHANWISAERLRLQRVEARVRSYLDRNPEKVYSSLPVSFSWEWDSVAKQLGVSTAMHVNQSWEWR